MASPAKRPCCDVSRELMDVIAKEDWTEVKNILSENSRHVADSAVTQLISKDQWSAVRQIIECVEDEDRTWNIGGIVVKSIILLSVAKRDWTCLKESPSERFPDSTLQWIIQQACKGATECKVVQFVLPLCADDRLDCVLTILVERRLWHAVLYVLKRGVSDSSKRRVVLEVCACCESVNTQDIPSNIFHFCADDQVDCVLTTLVERRQWRTVAGMLKKGVSDSNKKWAVHEACKHCEYNQLESLIQNILPHCADDQLDSVLTTLVERRMWKAVGVFLKKKGFSDSNKKWAVQEACKDCEYYQLESLILNILPHCADDQLDGVLKTLVEHYHFRTGDTLPVILCHCDENQLESVLTTLVERRLWKPVGEILQRGVGETQRRWAVEEASKNAMRDDFVQYMLPFCLDQHLDSVLSNLVTRRQWKPVAEILQRGVGETQRRWAVEEASKNAMRDDFVQYMLPFCLDQHLDSVLSNLVTRRLWKPVGELLQRGISETQRRWAVEEASKHAMSDDFVQYMLPYCSDQYFDSVLSHLVKRRLWKSVGELLQQGVSKPQRRLGVEEASKEAAIETFCLYVHPYCSNHHLRIVPYLVENGLWDYVQQILHCTAKHFLCQLITQEGHTIKDDSGVWAIPNNCHLNAAHAVKLFGMAKKETASKVHKLHTCLGLKEDLCDLLYTSYIHQVCFELFSEKKTAIMTDSTRCLVLNIYLEIISCIQTISSNSVKDMVDYVKSDKCKITTLVSQLRKLSSSSVPLCYPFLKQFSLYCTCRHGNADDDVFLMMFAVLPLNPELQNVALRIMLRHKRWDVISQADLSGVWEQDRRHLLQAAVKQRQWSVVKRWADHTLYDDQSVWALNEALNEKQWDVALLLADHGLTDIDRMRVHYRLAKYADWDVILHMFERGADVAEIKERLGRMKDNKRIPENVIRCINDRCSEVKTLEKEIQMAKSVAFKTACHCCNWIMVLFTLIRNPSKESVYCALKVGIKKKAWHVVMQLVRVGMDANLRESLLYSMLERRQWGVCRVLLEQGLSVQLCLKVLPELMEMNQWTLVARVMEHDVGDDVRKQVMKRAWERREGSVVWLCIKSLPTPLSVEEREALFQRAFSCEMWQVIKPLVEEKDETGIRHRDTALLEAIEQHQWDLVDHCQRHHADINMKDDDGHTPLQRAAMKKDWEAVEELVVRDGDPNLLDREGYTVLHRVIAAEQWGTVDLLIQYHADIHITDTSWYGAKGVTPLSMLIDARQGNIIERTLLWCPDQSKGLNILGETTLHVACLSGCYDSLYYLVARGVNPSAVTYRGQSSLVHAVLYKRYPQRMVAECIRLGFSTHQPKLTNIEVDLTSLTSDHSFCQDLCSLPQSVTSPSLCAVLRGLPVVMQMLYESGACTQRELFRLYTELPKLADPNTVKGRKLQERAGHNLDAYKNFVLRLEDIALPYLTDIATTPRSLESTCRLVISHSLTLSKTRHRDVDQLPLPERMKNFVMFSDLTDPDFGKDTT